MSEETQASRRWAYVSALFTVAGIACLTVLIWALNVRLDRWEVQPFVLLIYAAVAAAITSSVVVRRARRDGATELEPMRGARLLLSLAVVLILLWVWFPPMERLVGWWIRQVSLFRFG